MRRLLSLFLSAGLLLTLCACGGPPAPEESSASLPDSSGSESEEEVSLTTPFTLPVFPDFSLHPTLGANRANLTLAPLLYEGLFLVDESFEAVPVLCQSYTASEDKLVWTFTLRSGITFSDGTPLTGQEAADALELARSEQSRYHTRLAHISSITAEENTITITLSRPNGNLPALLDIPIAHGSGDRPSGTGPYVLSSEDDTLLLTARKGWWQGKSLPFQSIPLYPMSKSDELIYAFDAGNISLLDVDLMATNAMGYGGNYQTWDYATTDLIYLGFNTASGVCRSAQVRLAISAAIDRQAIAQATYASHAVPSSLPVHPNSTLFSQEIASRLDYAPDTLAGQLEELGLGGRELRLLVNSENEAKVSAAQLIAYQLGSAGLTVQVEQLSYEDFTAALSQGSFDLYLGETVLTADFDLSPLLSSSGSLNYGRWQSGTCDALLSVLRAAGPEEKVQAAAALFSHLADEMPLAPLIFKNGSALTQWGRLTGLTPIRNNVFYQLEGWIIQ